MLARFLHLLQDVSHLNELQIREKGDLIAEQQTTGPFHEDRDYRRRKLPTPKPDRFAYHFNRLLALATSPRRLLNYLRYLGSHRSKHADYLPIKLDIENVSRCNFHCTMCQVSDWPKYQRAGDMTLRDFKSLIDSQYGLLEIKLQGMGEPLLGRDTFLEMIHYARSKHIWVRTTTNGSLLHLNKNYRKLIDSGVNEVQISFDGACKETFEKIRRGSRFERVVENSKVINEYCSARGLLRTRMWVVLQSQNIHELSDFVDLGREMGFQRLTFALNLTDWGQEAWNTVNSAVTVEDSVSPQSAQEVIERGSRAGLEVTFWNITSKYSVASPEKLCPWPFQRAYVSSDMRIVPCCKIANPEVADLGDGRDFTTQWHGEAYQQFRQTHLSGNIPKICKGCYE